MTRIDKFRGSVVVQWLEHLVHIGKLFIGSVSNTINAAATLALHITTPAIGYYYATVTCSANKSGSLVFREADTLQGGTGTAVTIYNYDRNALNTISVTGKQDATVTVTGTVLKTIAIPGYWEEKIKFVLKSSTTYTAIFTADGNTTFVSLNADIHGEEN